MFAGEFEGARITLSEDLQALIREWISVQSVSVPATLNATLRPYQHRGFEWLYKNYRIGFGSLLADDMGLGKTIQVISLLLKLREENNGKANKALVIVPTSLLTNWSNELNRFAPTLSYFIYHGG